MASQSIELEGAMPYGVMDESTRHILSDAGLNPDELLAPEDAEAGIDCAILFDGALDESFIMPMETDFRRVVDVIFDRLAADFPDNHVEVATAHVYIGEDFIEGSGYLDESYSRRTDNREVV